MAPVNSPPLPASSHLCSVCGEVLYPDWNGLALMHRAGGREHLIAHKCKFGHTHYIWATIRENAVLLPPVSETRFGGGTREVRDTTANSRPRFQRHFVATEVRVEKGTDGKTHLKGYAALWNSPSVPLPAGNGKTFIETIAPGAFRDSLAGGADIQLIHAHKPNDILCRTTAGTLKLAEDDKGLAFDGVLADTTLAHDVTADVEHKNIRGMSFGFDEPEDEWNKGDDGIPRRILKKIPLAEISTTPYPAYPETTVDVRAVGAVLARLDKGEKNVRCGGFDSYYGGGTDIRSVCQSAQRSCRDAHDAMEQALHTIKTRKNEPNEHDMRAVGDMRTHMRAMMSKARALRDATADLNGGNQANPPADAGTGGAGPAAADAGATRDYSRLVEFATRELGMSASEAQALLPASTAKRDEVVEKDGSWFIVDSDGKEIDGPYDSEEEADAALEDEEED